VLHVVTNKDELVRFQLHHRICFSLIPCLHSLRVTLSEAVLSSEMPGIGIAL
jgi:hypothetical protein